MSGQAVEKLFEAAVNANMGRLIGLARVMLGAPTRDSKGPEDLVQDALMKLFRQRDSYDWSDGGWSLMAKSVARNVISCRRRKLGSSLDADEALSDSLGSNQDPAERMISAETTAVMRRWIEELPDAWRQALVLREQQELSYKEIAELLEASEPQVKTWLHRARARLLGQMADEDVRKPRGRSDEGAGGTLGERLGEMLGEKGPNAKDAGSKRQPAPGPPKNRK